MSTPGDARPRPAPYELVDNLAGRAAELARRGWLVHNGFDAPDEPWALAPAGWVAAGPVTDERQARRALVLGARGAGLVVTADESAPWYAGFAGDLRRLAELAGPTTDDSAPLTADQRRLLGLLAAGTSIADAARTLHVSLRTANRRIAQARTALGVASTREAVVRYAAGSSRGQREHW